MQTKDVTTSFKATRPQKLSPVMTGLLIVNRHYCVFWIHCNSTLWLISALAEHLFHLVARYKQSRCKYICLSMYKPCFQSFKFVFI